MAWPLTHGELQFVIYPGPRLADPQRRVGRSVEYQRDCRGIHTYQFDTRPTSRRPTSRHADRHHSERSRPDLCAILTAGGHAVSIDRPCPKRFGNDGINVPSLP
jgi:hypothetical protein